MRGIKRYAPQVLPFLAWILAMGIALFVRFSHPEMTETQLLLNYPLWWIVVVGLAFLGGFLFPR